MTEECDHGMRKGKKIGEIEGIPILRMTCVYCGDTEDTIIICYQGYLYSPKDHDKYLTLIARCKELDEEIDQESDV